MEERSVRMTTWKPSVRPAILNSSSTRTMRTTRSTDVLTISSLPSAASSKKKGRKEATSTRDSGRRAYRTMVHVVMATASVLQRQVHGRAGPVRGLPTAPLSSLSTDWMLSPPRRGRPAGGALPAPDVPTGAPVASTSPPVFVPGPLSVAELSPAAAAALPSGLTP
jgi:hypothetical protein